MNFNHHIFSVFGFKKHLGYALLILLSLNSCKKTLDAGPPANLIDAQSAFESNGTAESVLSGIFNIFSSVGTLSNGPTSTSLLMGLAADELVNYGSTPVNIQFFTNTLSTQGTTGLYFWPTIYQQIYNCNAAVNGLSSTTKLTPAIRQQLLGEAKFMRAFIYFYAVNLYGDVPLPLNTDYVANNAISRTPQAKVYEQIIQDLKDAQGLLSDGKYLNGMGVATTDRLRPNKQAASAMLARVYLYTKNWQDAEQQASSVIGTSIYILEPNLNQVFLKATRETIWSLQPVSIGANNGDAYKLVITTDPANSVAAQLPLSNIVVKAFEPGDARLTNWVGRYNAAASKTIQATTYYYAFKYKANTVPGGGAVPVVENIIALRLAEQYLIRAEARAQQGNLDGAKSDLNIIRARATLAPTTANSKDDVLAAIAHERQVELFTEWGHRWFDLRRTGKIDAVMNVVAPQKGASWNTNQQLLPIPASEIAINHNLVQNPGY
jgi:hypothetical protein